MEFLYPSETVDSDIILIMVVRKGAEVMIECRRWPSTDDLASVPLAQPFLTHPLHKILRKESPLGDSIDIPLLLIPLTKASAFLLVLKNRIWMFQGISSGDLTSRCTQFTHLRDASATSRREPLWTQWARPSRNMIHTANKGRDDIYVCREDGLVGFLEISSPDGERIVNTSFSAGFLSCPVDTAFTVLPHELSGSSDILVAVGAWGSGGLHMCHAKQRLKCHQPIPNWSPLQDFLAVPNWKGSPAQRNHFIPPERTRLLGIAGHDGKGGTVCELQHCLEAQIGILADVEDSDSITDMWILSSAHAKSVDLVVARYFETFVLRVKQDGISLELMSQLEVPELALGATTLAVRLFEAGILIQITKQSVRLSYPGFPTAETILSPERTFHLACIDSDQPLFLTATGSGSTINFELSQVQFLDRILSSKTLFTFKSDQTPTAVDIRQSGTKVLIAVAFSGVPARIYCYDLESCDSVEVQCTEVSPLQTLSFIAHENDHGCNLVLLGGTVLGHLYELLITLGNDTGEILDPGRRALIDGLAVQQMLLKLVDTHVLGNTLVSIKEYDSMSGKALLRCGLDFWLLQMHSHYDHHRFEVSRITLVDQEDAQWKQAQIDAACIIPANAGIDGLNGAMVCITWNQLCIASLAKFAKIVPRALEVPGKVAKLAFCPRIGRVLTGSYCSEQTGANDETSTRAICLRLSLVDIDTGTSLSYWSSKNVMELFNSKITTVLDWVICHDESEYHMFIMCTEKSDGEKRGSMLFFALKVDDNAGQTLELKKKMDFSEPIDCISSLKSSFLIFCTGKTVCVLGVNPQTRRRQIVAEWDNLPSRAVHLSVSQDNLIIITCAREPLYILRFSESGSVCQLSLHGHCHAAGAGLTHIAQTVTSDSEGAHRKSCSLIWTSQRGGIVRGVPMPHQHVPNPRALFPSFGLKLPHSIETFQQGDLISEIRPNKRQSIVGATVDGTIYRFTTLEHFEVKLLSFLQELLLNDRWLAPHSRNGYSRPSVDVEQRRLERTHINGDLLYRLSQHGSQHLSDLLLHGRTAIPKHQTSILDVADSPAARKSRIIKFLSLYHSVEVAERTTEALPRSDADLLGRFGLDERTIAVDLSTTRQRLKQPILKVLDIIHRL